jgi:hypothetical protein
MDASWQEESALGHKLHLWHQQQQQMLDRFIYRNQDTTLLRQLHSYMLMHGPLQNLPGSTLLSREVRLKSSCSKVF